MADWKNAGFGVYIHWPFCAAKCPYCDFNSHVRKAVDQSAWKDALLNELRNAAARTPNRTVNTIFFGGGTPSLMPPATVSAIVSEIGKLWRLSNDAEITLEANPTSVEAGKFKDFGVAGVNRISMGVQALNDPDLKRLGRMHTAAEARQAFDTAKSVFDRVSFDLIYARQDQSLADWKDELRAALDMAVDHLSLYQLTIEPNTRFGEQFDRGKLRGLPSDDLSADMFDLTQQICDQAGMSAYEVSNHARDGAQSRHNLVYWRYGDYVGVGPGAHGRITQNGQRIATTTRTNPEQWLNAVETFGTAATDSEILSASDQGTEYLMMSLRLAEGCNLERFSALSGSELDSQRISQLVDDGLLVQSNSHIQATNSGRIILNSVLRTLLV